MRTLTTSHVLYFAYFVNTNKLKPKKNETYQKKKHTCPKLGWIRTENANCNLLRIISESLDKGLKFDFGHGMARKCTYFDPYLSVHCSNI